MMELSHFFRRSNLFLVLNYLHYLTPNEDWLSKKDWIRIIYSSTSQQKEPEQREYAALFWFLFYLNTGNINDFFLSRIVHMHWNNS